MIEPGDGEWGAVLSRLPHDVYHTAGYAEVCVRTEGHPVKLAVVESCGELLVAPLLVRAIDRVDESGLVDFSSPYGYPTPLCSSGDARVQSELLGELLGELAALGGVSAFFRSHPFLGLEESVWEQVGRSVCHGSVVYLDLEAIADDPAASFRPGHRREIRLLGEAGYTAEADRWDLYPDFTQIYAENMERVNACPSLRFGDEYFSSLRRHVPEYTRYLTVRAPSGALAAATIVFICGDYAAYHLSAGAGAYLADAPIKAVFPLMVRESVAAGAKWLNLGGGVGGAKDSLFDFKHGFSKLCAEFHTYRVVLDAKAYERLSPNDAPDGFFPAYRYGGA
jgi:hypothetical protein